MHTPGEWRLVNGHLWRDDTPIASMDTEPAERDANAAFIVLACNMHDELLAACKAAREATALAVRNAGNPLDTELLDALDSTIAKASPEC